MRRGDEVLRRRDDHLAVARGDQVVVHAEQVARLRARLVRLRLRLRLRLRVKA